ncbi:NAD binding 4, Sterile, Epimerase, Polysacc synt 2, and/or 3Beta HSD domain containing protein [Asbolus verrucosus]|uniref:Fatty acyl-CoA reductase n=1 Tax=Asbolus verrucosus TaxID=1661398 RepID=A0A482VYU2_ASBVE|nr:NAD binding 4, Sterile, Epimerase, Polysacc synt 2, and/or 3Beta HSD domain containing protein [Asbolus verrucosus]
MRKAHNRVTIEWGRFKYNETKPREAFVTAISECATKEGSAMVKMIKDEPNRITDLFIDKTVLITGGTGFLGKVLIEKLLRCCLGLKKIYMIVRPKKGKTVHDRMEEMFDGPLFELVKKQQGKSIFAKVEAIPGDISAPDLDISESDRERLTEEVQFIYHSAATVKFDEKFKTAVLLNVRGTKLMLDLAKQCKNLMIFCHLSTAYCHEEQDVLHETIYPPPTNPHRVIEMAEWLDEATLEVISTRIRGKSANNYTFTKALGEGLVNEQMDKLPVIIQRPSAVIPILIEPIPGWTDNINGPTGLLIGAGKGEILDIGRKVIINTPFNWVLWYPGGSMNQSRLVHNISFFLFQLLPAIFIDALLILLGFKPVLLRVQRRIARGYEIFEYYANRKWNFRKDQAKFSRQIFNAKEKAMFEVDPPKPDYFQYFTDCTRGARLYILKEADEDLPLARKHMKVMWCVDKLCKLLMVFGLLYYVINKVFVPLFVK